MAFSFLTESPAITVMGIGPVFPRKIGGRKIRERVLSPFAFVRDDSPNPPAKGGRGDSQHAAGFYRQRIPAGDIVLLAMRQPTSIYIGQQDLVSGFFLLLFDPGKVGCFASGNFK
jgi:hypothetical protein